MPDFSMIPDAFGMIEQGREHPDSYWGAVTDLQDQGWVLTFARHRDSDHLEISNYETILTSFAEKYELNEDYRVEGSSHWLVGWMDQMMVRALQCNCEDWEQAHITVHPDRESKGLKLWRCHTCGGDFGIANIRPIFYSAIEFKERMEEYPVLDEEDFSRREYEELMEYIESVASSFVSRNEGDTIAEGWEPDYEKIFEHLFREYSVSRVDDLNYEWIEDAVLAIADEEGKKL